MKRNLVFNPLISFLDSISISFLFSCRTTLATMMQRSDVGRNAAVGGIEISTGSRAAEI